MSLTFDVLLAEHASPVLAGLKTSNLISCARDVVPDLPARLPQYEQAFAQRGVRFRILCACDRRYLLFVYRPAWLIEDLASVETHALLKANGYPMESGLEALLDHLAERIDTSAVFPHEIGLFLGYPVEDVSGFMEHGGKGCKLSGYWKVYGDAQAARRLFRRFDLCRSKARACIDGGMTIIELFCA